MVANLSSHQPTAVPSWLTRVLSHPASFATLTTMMTIMGAGTSLLAPMILDPVAFGAFSLVSTIFQLVAAFDLGMSQLADRRISQQQATHQDDLLALRYALALFMVLVIAPIAGAITFTDGRLPSFAMMAAIVAGATFMASNGLVSLYRTQAQIPAFTRTALLMQLGMTAPRLGGLLIAGVNGCFAGLALWYCALLGLILKPVRLPLETLLSPLKQGLPLFVFNGLWLIYLAAGRWISWHVSADQTAFGLLAFGASFVLIGTGLITNISQLRYPLILKRACQSSDEAAAMMLRDMVLISLMMAGLICVALLTARSLIEQLFPHYHAALNASLILSVSGLPLALIAWTLPLTISLSRHVMRDGMTLFAQPLLCLWPMMAFGQSLAGIEGQAWALLANAALLAALHFFTLARTGLMKRSLAFNALMLLGLLLALFAHAVQEVRSEPAKPYQPPPNRRLSFEERFNTLSLWNGTDGRWLPHFPDGRRTIVTNHEREFYVSPNDPEPLSQFNPFSLITDKAAEAPQAQGLAITARPLPEALKDKAGGLDYASGMLTSAPSFQQTYGYFEIRARVPKGRGLWPAFWLAPADQTWPPEIDVFEVHGDRLEGYWATVHQQPDLNRFTLRWQDHFSQSNQFRIPTPDLSLDFHDYGVEWGPYDIIWTFDGQQVAKARTPPDAHKPMMLILNLAVGGRWPGAPDSSTHFPATLQVQHIRVYHLNPDEGGSP